LGDDGSDYTNGYMVAGDFPTFKIYDTSEVLVILDGSLKVDFYNNKRKYLFSKILSKNDIIILLTYGHGFKILKNCPQLECIGVEFFGNEIDRKKGISQTKNLIQKSLSTIF